MRVDKHGEGVGSVEIRFAGKVLRWAEVWQLAFVNFDSRKKKLPMSGMEDCNSAPATNAPPTRYGCQPQAGASHLL